MATEVSVPQLGESVVEATVGRWLVEEGQQVEKDQPLVELLTDKTDTEINAPTAGVVRRVLKAEDEVVAVGETLCEIEAGATADASSGRDALEAAANRAASSGDDAESVSSSVGLASPSVRKVAREEGVDLQAVAGTGDRGRITRDDVLRAVQGTGLAAIEQPQWEVNAPDSPSKPRVAAAAPRAGVLPPATRIGAFKMPPYVAEEGDELIPFSRRRRIIADHMVFSKQNSPEVVTLAECDLDKTAKLRDAHKNQYKKEGVGLSFLAFVAAATCRALREFPELNARVLEDSYVLLRNIHLGVAVDTDEGLVVPVIRNADELTVKGIARSIQELAGKARGGKLTPDDLSSKTFTISNPGRQGNLVGGAILSQPNVGILRTGTIKKRPVVVEVGGEDAIVIHPVMYMALTYDHRIVDGVKANGFLHRVTEILERAEFEL